MTRHSFARNILVLAVAGMALATAAGDWPRWRGPEGDGISTESKWNPAALATPKVLWRKNVGPGYSSFAVKGNRVYTMGNRDNQDIVYCLDAASGEEIWQHPYACPANSQYPGPRATPTVDGSVVYTLSREGHLLCLDAKSGAVKWEKNLLSDLKAGNVGWGFAGSAVTEGNLLLVNAGQYGAALNKATGEKVWASPAGVGGYSTPVVFKCGTTECVAIFGQKALYAAELKGGKEMWSQKWETAYDVNAADPIIVKDRMFVSSGYDKGCAMLEFTATSAKPVWENKKMRNHFSSCVFLNGYIYGIDGNAGQPGDLVCLDWATGNERWRNRVGFGSLTVADNKLIVLNEAGDLFVAQATPDGYKEIASAKGVLGRTCWTVPVLSNGHIYCRNEKGDIVCIDVGK